MLATITQFDVGGLDKNFSYAVTDQTTRYTALVDPTGDIDSVLSAVSEAGCTIRAIWLTHTHHDHIDGIPAVLAHTPGVPIYVHEEGVLALRDYQNVHALKDGDTCQVGDTSFSLLHTPGHTPDGSCFFRTAVADEAPLLLSGDTLFVDGCGRVSEKDAPNLYSSLQLLKRLPGRTLVYPGHDYGQTSSSTIAHEMMHNRFLLAPDYETFLAERFPEA